MELEKDILRQFFGHRAVRQEMQRNAKDHRLVTVHDLREVRFRGFADSFTPACSAMTKFSDRLHSTYTDCSPVANAKSLQSFYRQGLRLDPFCAITAGYGKR